MYLFSCSSKLIFSYAGKWLLLLRREWKSFGGTKPSPAFILAHFSRSLGFHTTALYLRWDGLDSSSRLLLVFVFNSQWTEDRLSAATRTHIDVHHSLGIPLLLHFKLQGQLGRNLCQSCQAEKHKTNSPRRGCSVTHRDKGRMSHHESCGLCLHIR